MARDWGASRRTQRPQDQIRDAHVLTHMMSGGPASERKAVPTFLGYTTVITRQIEGLPAAQYRHCGHSQAAGVLRNRFDAAREISRGADHCWRLRRPLTTIRRRLNSKGSIVQSSIAIVGLACLVSVGCRGTGSPKPKADGSADRPAADGSADRPAAQDAVGEASAADSDTDTPVARPCDDGTGATDCCPSGAVAGGTCDGAISTCYSRCAFSDGSATQGTRSEFSCIQGLWLAGHGLFPCASSQQGERVRAQSATMGRRLPATR
jgi:hypothetical protein